MIYQAIFMAHNIKNHIGEICGTILFLFLGHNIDMTDKLITFIFSVGAGLFVHILKEINIGQIIVQLFKKKHDKKN
jgi:hypothetical protein